MFAAGLTRISMRRVVGGEVSWEPARCPCIRTALKGLAAPAETDGAREMRLASLGIVGFAGTALVVVRAWLSGGERDAARAMFPLARMLAVSPVPAI